MIVPRRPWKGDQGQEIDAAMRPKKDQRRVLDLVGQVYDAALDDKLWPGVAPQIARTFNATSAAVSVRNTRTGHVNLVAMTQDHDAQSLAAYWSYYGERDVSFANAAKIGLSEIVTGKDLVEDEEFEWTQIGIDFCRNVGGLFYIVGAFFPVADEEVGAVGIHRPRRGYVFGESDKRMAATFLPHLRRALQIRRRLTGPAIDRQATLEALDRSGVATLVVARDGCILYGNPAADLLLHQGGALRATCNRVVTVDRLATEQLTALVQASADTAAGRAAHYGGAVSIPRRGRLPLTLLVAPFHSALDGFGAPLPAAILFIRDPQEPKPARSAVRGLFGLTEAEATIAIAIADGKALDDIAARLGLSLNTVRTHLKSIYVKTGTNRQPQLVALLLRSVAAMASK